MLPPPSLIPNHQVYTRRVTPLLVGTHPWIGLRWQFTRRTGKAILWWHIGTIVLVSCAASTKSSKSPKKLRNFKDNTQHCYSLLEKYSKRSREWGGVWLGGVGWFHLPNTPDQNFSSPFSLLLIPSTMVPNNQESRCRYWVTRLSVRLFAHTAHSFCFLLSFLTCSATLILLLAHSLST